MVVALVDLSKAFNRVSLSMVIEDLYAMHVPPWLLLILISYLSGRSMVLCYKGTTSSPRNLPGSSPQGAFLGIFCFIVKYNGAALRPQIPRLMFQNDCKQSKMKTTCNIPSCVKHPKDTHCIYIDDLSEAEAIRLKKQLISDPITRPRPLNYHERTKHIYPAQSSLLQRNLYKIENFTINNQMQINEKKSNIMLFNKSRTIDFPPEFSFKNEEQLQVVEETRLLGVVLSSDLRWQANTTALCSRAMARMWLLRRMKALKLDPEFILDYYLKEVRSLAEQGVPIWNSGLNKSQVKEIEKIQKVALKIILGQQYESYTSACLRFGLQKLSVRRLEISTKFAIKLYKSKRCEEFFSPAVRNVNTRSEGPLLLEDRCNTRRCYGAPHNYLTRLVNKNKAKILRSRN